MTTNDLAAAVNDFRRARQEAGLQQIMARWTGQSLDLLSFEDVRRTLKAHTMVERGLRVVPLDAIVGSVGRYRDFTRSFLPKADSDQSRWAGVKVAYEKQGLPPITVYQIGDVYFVQDGNHRVSVARQLGNRTIEAYVTEVKTRVPLTPDMQPDDIILKAEHQEFLDQTRLDALRPEVDFSLTAPGKYPLLLEHIEVHRYFMGIEQQREIPYEEAVTHWCDQIYLPTIRLVREAGLLRDFPERTEADLYIWLAEHKAEVEDALAMSVPTAAAAADLAEQFGSYRPHGVLDKVLTAVLPGSSAAAASVGRWRRERQASPGETRFVRTLLVPIFGHEADWSALEQAIAVARLEGSHIFALYGLVEAAQRQSIVVQALESEFYRRCYEAGVAADFVAEPGNLEELIYRRERWIDLMLLRPFQDPARNGGSAAYFQRVIRRTACPVLVVPGQVTALKRVLLAYDHRPASDEALYVATYLASRWQAPLSVLTVHASAAEAEDIQQKARRYLTQNDLAAEYIVRQGEVVPSILAAAVDTGCDLILVGSYRLNAMMQLVLGNTVQRLLAESPVPLLICR